jgi:tRNA-specific 2-thiouridylase
MSGLPKVVVAMSGGVDSSVAAALLVEQGYPVIGMMLRLWSEPGSENANRCCTPDAMSQARRVAAQLGIPFYAIDARDRFRSTVVQTFIDGYDEGITPNPCISCNRLIRWGLLLDTGQAMGAEMMATGHYARVRKNDDGSVSLLRGLDTQKDQSYVLSALSQGQLQHTILPLGDLEKPEVRELARKFGLAVAERAESQDLCFLAGEDYRQFLKRNVEHIARSGPIANRHGEVIGEHEGLAFYTIGQRKGIKIASSEALYVIEKNSVTNTLVVGPLAELGQTTLLARRVNWISGQVPEGSFEANVKIRYRAESADAKVTPRGPDLAEVEFYDPRRGITAGQLAVFYQGDVVLGSGIIAD